MPELVDDYQFVRVNGKTYTVTEVNIPTVDRLIEEIKSTNTERVASLTSQLRTDFVREANTLANNEHTRIVQDLQRVGVSVPSNLHGLPLVVIAGELCPVRSVQYATTRVYGSISGWVNRLGTTNGVFARLSAAMNNTPIITPEIVSRSAEYRMVVTGTPRFSHTMAVMYALWQNKIVMSRQMYHTMSRVATSANGDLDWYQMCIGNSTGAQYWALPMQDFIRQVGEINLDSPATTEVMFGPNPVSVVNIIDNMVDRQVRLLAPAERW